LGTVVTDLADHDGTFHARILGDLADWSLQRPLHDLDAGLQVRVVGPELGHRGLGVEQGGAAAGHNALFRGGLGGAHGVGDAILLLLVLDQAHHNAVMERAEGHDAAPLAGAVLGVALVSLGAGLVVSGVVLVAPGMETSEPDRAA
jgi:hypothetical protein